MRKRSRYVGMVGIARARIAAFDVLAFTAFNHYRELTEMKKRALLAHAIIFLVLSSSARAVPITLTFDELPPLTPVNGMSVSGVTFGFTVGGMPSSDALYNCGAFGICPPASAFIQPPSLEGNAAGILTLDFPVPSTLLSFGVVRNTFDPLTPGASVTLLLPELALIRILWVDMSPMGFGFSEGLFSYSGGELISRASIAFPNPQLGNRFAIDNLAFELIPEPTSVLLLGTGLAVVALAVRRGRKTGKRKDA